jgi:alpha-ketoglutarate-dependent taurine dioxygenase
VLVFRDQILDDDQQIDFTSQLGELHVSIASNRSDLERRVRSDLVSDISNVGADGGILSPDDRRRIQAARKPAVAHGQFLPPPRRRLHPAERPHRAA